MTDLTATNDYWEAVKNHVDPVGVWNTATVGRLPSGGDWDRWQRETPQRHDHVKRYSWTITDPATVAFVAEHSGGRMVDPMAGTGWWAYVLAPHGIDVASSDLEPGGNEWHEGEDRWVPVATASAVDAVVQHPDRTLFLAWPPYDRPDGVDTVRAYRGDRLILIHEDEGGCIGDDALFVELDTNWVEVAEHVPVQWYGIHDRVTVYNRKTAA